MSKPDVFLAIYGGDYYKKTDHLATVEHGAYFLMLMSAWHHDGKLPANDEQLRRITRMSKGEWKRSRETLLAFFYEDGASYRSKRIDEELTKAKANIEQKSLAGQASASAREKARLEAEAVEKANSEVNGRLTAEQTEGQRKSNPSPSPSSSSVFPNGNTSLISPENPSSTEPLDLTPPEQPSAPKPNLDVEFEEFWQAYPGRLGDDGKLHKEGKKVAKAAFPKARKRASLATLMSAAESYGRSKDPRYVKDASGWLNGEKWADEVIQGPPIIALHSPVASARDASRDANQAEIDRIIREANGEPLLDTFDGLTIEGNLL